jgi:hypothetical protein
MALRRWSLRRPGHPLLRSSTDRQAGPPHLDRFKIRFGAVTAFSWQGQAACRYSLIVVDSSTSTPSSATDSMRRPSSITATDGYTSPESPSTHRDWVVQQARNLAADTRLDSLRFLLRDRGDKYSPAFDAIFSAQEMDILKTVPRAPRMNAHGGRVIKTHPASYAITC